MRRVVFLAVLAAVLAPATFASAETPAEKQLAQKIGSHLKLSGELRNYRVGVKFQDGVAYLSGSVSSAEQRDTAVRLAQQVDGVTHVVSKLDYPIEGERSASNLESNSTSSRRDMSSELNRASFEGSRNAPSGVMQAYEQPGRNQGAQFQQIPMSQGRSGRSMAPPGRRNNMPVPYRPLPGIMPVRQGGAGGMQQASCQTCDGGGMGPGMMGPGGGPAPMGFVPSGSGRGPSYDNAQMPGYAWPSYASYPNYAALTYPQQYSPTAWPYIGPFYPYPQVPLAWRKVSLEWDDGWWFLDFSAHNSSH
jgi:hypothetical protein